MIIPAFNEAVTVGQVVRATLSSGVGLVYVVVDGSSDDTAKRAQEAGAVVSRLSRNLGKGGAVATALAETRSSVVVLLDADLVGVTPGHVRALVDPVVAGECDATLGVMRAGGTRTSAAQRITVGWTGQRALRRDLLVGLELRDTRYAMESAIDEALRDSNALVRVVRFAGVTRRTKKDKQGRAWGLAARLRMIARILRWEVRQRVR